MKNKTIIFKHWTTLKTIATQSDGVYFIFFVLWKRSQLSRCRSYNWGLKCVNVKLLLPSLYLFTADAEWSWSLVPRWLHQKGRTFLTSSSNSPGSSIRPVPSPLSLCSSGFCPQHHLRLKATCLPSWNVWLVQWFDTHTHTQPTLQTPWKIWTYSTCSFHEWIRLLVLKQTDSLVLWKMTPLDFEASCVPCLALQKPTSVVHSDGHLWSVPS